VSHKAYQTIETQKNCEIENIENTKLLGFEQIEAIDDVVATAEAIALAFNKRGELPAPSTTLNIPSDVRLKTDVEPAGEASRGLKLYNFRYIGETEVFRGLMAQDLLADARYCDAVEMGQDGFYRVDYAKVGLGELVTEEMRVAGERAARRLAN
jgi:hypothetical protein